MRVYQTDDGDIRFLFTERDITNHNLSMADFLTGSAKTRTLLMKLLRYADRRFGFRPRDGHLTIGAIPISNNLFILTLSDKAQLPGHPEHSGADRLASGDGSAFPGKGDFDDREDADAGRQRRASRRSDSSAADDDFALFSGTDKPSADSSAQDSDEITEEYRRDILRILADSMLSEPVDDSLMDDDRNTADTSRQDGDKGSVPDWENAPASADSADPPVDFSGTSEVSEAELNEGFDGDAGNSDGSLSELFRFLSELSGPEDAAPAAPGNDSAAPASGDSSAAAKEAPAEGSVFNFTKVRNLFTYAEVSKTLSVDSLLLYDDVEHCYHLCLLPRKGAEDDYERARSLAAEYSVRAANPSIRYYREQFPCIAEDHALEMLRTL